MTPQEYTKHALRTLYPGLTTNERLSLCGLGMSGETGEVIDLLTAHLYHSQVIDVQKVKNEAGDVIWYIAILGDTLAIPLDFMTNPQITYPALTQSEKLSFCGLKLAIAVGNITDLLKKYLHHRNGKPLDVERIKSGLESLMQYLSILCDLGFTVEDMMIANVAKLEQRHMNGFTRRYSSDSQASV